MIRFATAGDEPRLIEMSVRFLMQSRYGPLFNEFTTPTAIALLIRQVLNVGAIFVAEVEKTEAYDLEPCLQCFDVQSVHCGDCECCPRLVGMLAAVIVPHPLTGQAFAEELAWWVEPEYRNGMLGPKMLRAMEEWATRNRANMVKMVAPAGSTVGDFYTKCGYEAVETAYIKSI